MNKTYFLLVPSNSSPEDLSEIIESIADPSDEYKPAVYTNRELAQEDKDRYPGYRDYVIKELRVSII